MEYQLVLQVQNVDSGDLARLLRWEKRIAECLAESATVDGHDLGSGEFNIFIDTDKPEATFRSIMSCKGAETMGWPTAAAYRHTDSEDYVALWPPEQKQFDVA